MTPESVMTQGRVAMEVLLMVAGPLLLVALPSSTASMAAPLMQLSVVLPLLPVSLGQFTTREQSKTTWARSSGPRLPSAPSRPST